jgi:signal transduction histidine kinase
MHRRLFVWFGVAILATVMVAAATYHLLSGESPWRRDLGRAERFVAERFSETWDDPPARTALAASLARELELGVVLREEGRPIGRFGPSCANRHSRIVAVPAARAASVELCVDYHRHGAPTWVPLAAVIAGGLMIWVLSGLLGRHLARPLRELVRVTREIGDGRLDSRARLARHHRGEVGELAEAVNDMAIRIERQLGDQRELLATVSHEIRTPLGHMRVLADMFRDSHADPKLVTELEHELREADELVDQLLASSRLDFERAERLPLDPFALAERALKRAGLDAGLLEVEGTGECHVDPTLIARALANLLRNAERHGEGATALRVRSDPERTTFEVWDDGPGFSDEGLERAFDPFYGGDGGRTAKSSLGLGLALVDRIARAHGGRAFAENRSEGGARVGFYSTFSPSK